MFYILTMLVPIIILGISYFAFDKPKSSVGIVNWLLITAPIMLLYSFILYWLEMKDILHTSWTFYTILIFSIIIYPIIFVVKLILYFRKQQ